MQKGKRYVSFWWLVPYLVVFTGSIIYFFLKTLQNFENIIGLVLFSFLLAFFLLEYLKFSLFFGKEGLEVKGVFQKDYVIPYGKITKQYVRQTYLQKLFGLQNLMIRFESEKQRERVSIKAFGFSFRYYGLAGHPGVWGELLTIPCLKRKNLDSIQADLQKRKLVSSEHIGIGYPIYGKAVKLRYLFIWVILLILFILLIIAGLIYWFPH